MDLILFNGNIVTMDKEKPKVQAVAVDSGKILRLGNDSEILPLKGSQTKLVDLNGKLLLPGFNDSHMHLLSYGSSLVKANLIGTTSIEHLVEQMKDFIKDKEIQNGQWVEGRGWNHDFFEVNRFPTRYDLDKISSKHPIIVTRACGHVSVVNSKALEMAGITKDTLQIQGGHFDLDQQGEPLGIMREKALNLVLGCVPQPSLEDIKSMLLMAAKNASEAGITSIQTDDFEALSGTDFTTIIKAYKELTEAGELPLRIYEQCLLPTTNKLERFFSLGYNTGVGNEFFKIGPLKLLADGSLGARTAYMCEPYADDPSTQGIAVYNQEQLDELVLMAHNEGMQIAVHCIGDKIMYMTFESYEKALKGKPKNDHRHSIIHCQITDNTLLDKYRDNNVIAHIQPIFIDYDLHIVESRVGKEKASTSYNWKSMLNRGVHVACGSDSPVEPFNVLRGIYCAVTRKDLKGYPETGWLPNQKLTVYEAVHGYTLGAAFASFEEDIKGSVTPGKLADFVVLSEDIFEISPDKIKDVEVLKTIINGRIVFEK